MTMPLDKFENSTELRQLLVAVALGDATDAQAQRLNELLLGDENLRHEAARFFEEEAVLRREFALLGRVVEFHNPPERESRDKCAPSPAASSGCEARSRKVPWQRTYLAVALLVCAIAGAIWFERQSSTSAPGEAMTHELAPSPHINSTSPLQRVLPLTASGSILSPVTHVSWSGPRFASELSANPPNSPMRKGVIPFTSAFGRPAEGFMVCLQPNTLMDLVVAADSDGENALAVIEFDGVGMPTGRRISFSNSAGNGAADAVVNGKLTTITKKGRLGIWSERNDSASPRYYLFTGVHKLLNRSADDSWHVSRLSPFVEEADLFHVGWDDSGMPPNGDKDLPQFPDEDFDDVSATIRIRKSHPELSQRPPGVHIHSKISANDADSRVASVSESDMYPFTVAAGQVAIVKVCSRSGAPIEIAVFEKGSDKLRWNCQQEKSHSPTLGICAIENNTTEPREFYLVGQKKTSSADGPPSTLPLFHSVLFEKESLITVGFDDVKKDSDFNTVRVDILTMDDL
jgi:hypothetical protein